MWVEKTLPSDKRFHLPSKKALQGTDFEVILVDCTESPIERPKKIAKVLFRQEKATHNKDNRICGQKERKDTFNSASARQEAR
jgi:hypothetical protein